MKDHFKGIDVTLFIFVITMFGYVLSFFFELGYNQYYMLPMEFIEITKNYIFRSIGLGVMMLILYYVLTKISYSHWNFKGLLKEMLKSKKAIVFVFVVLSIAYFYAGFEFAKGKREFFVTIDKNDYILARVYHNNLILIDNDKELREQGNFKIIPINSLEENIFVQRQQSQ